MTFRNTGLWEKYGSKYCCHNFLFGVFSEEKKTVTLGAIVWMESSSELYALYHIFLFPSCADSVVEMGRCSIYLILLFAVRYHLWFWFTVLSWCNSGRDSCCKEFQVVDWLWAKECHVQNVSLCDDLKSHLNFTIMIWFQWHRLLNNTVLSI